MKYICVQPDVLYFHWQIEVMLTNFKRVGVDLKDCIVVFLYQDKISEEFYKLQKHYKEVDFHLYADNRVDKTYIPSIKPYGMYRFFKENKIEDESFFYHDCDILLKKKIDLKVDKHSCLMSNTIGYIGYNYLIQKGEGQLNKMAQLVDVDVQVIKDNQDSSGGAQYLFSNDLPEDYWYKVYLNSNSLYAYLNARDTAGNPNLIQKWCAEMWSTLWNMWYFKVKTKVVEQLDFCFATDFYQQYDKCDIYHNAGVTVENKDHLFFKSDFTCRYPYKEDFSYVDSRFCSFIYTEAVREVASVLEKV